MRVPFSVKKWSKWWNTCGPSTEKFTPQPPTKFLLLKCKWKSESERIAEQVKVKEEGVQGS